MLWGGDKPKWGTIVAISLAMTQSRHYLARPEQVVWACFVRQLSTGWGIYHSLIKELIHMRKIVLAAAVAGAALSLAACSKGEEAADATADSAMADTEANAEAAAPAEGADAAAATAEEATDAAAPAEGAAEEAPAE